MTNKEKLRKALAIVARRNDLTAIELEALKEVARDGLMKKRIPDDVRDRLIELKYVQQKLGGPVATSEGKLYAASHKK